jgi:recombination protein RecA
MFNLSEETMAYLKKRSDGFSLSKASDRVNIKHIPTGIFALDLALMGGIPENFITLVYGQQGKGKTLLAYKAVAGIQKKYPDKMVVWVDAEGTLKPNATWAETNGVNLENLYVYEPSSGEDAVDMCLTFLKDENVSLVVLDSIPALTSVKRQENSVEDQVMTEFAKLVQPLMQNASIELINARKKKQSRTFIVINQWRLKAGFSMGDNRVLPGGQAQHFFASLKLEMYNKEIVGKTLRGLEVVDHNDHSFKIEKYKVSNTIRTGEFTLSRNPDSELLVGTIDDYDTVVNVAQKFGLVTGAGQGWQFTSAVDGVINPFKSKKEIVNFVKTNPEEYDAMKMYLISTYRKESGLSEHEWY